MRGTTLTNLSAAAVHEVDAEARACSFEEMRQSACASVVKSSVLLRWGTHRISTGDLRDLTLGNVDTFSASPLVAHQQICRDTVCGGQK